MPAHVLFPQVSKVVQRYLRDHVRPLPPADVLDVFLSPYYGWVIERLVDAIKLDAAHGTWAYEVATKVSDILGILDRVPASHKR